MNKPLCIYHGKCLDGFTAAWVVYKAFYGAVDFHSGVYLEDPPDVKGRTVIIVDFSYKRTIMERILKEAFSVLVLDHHKTAQADLEGFAGKVVFDMERSGAGITWDHFFPGRSRPRALDYVEDRDLWRFALPNSRAVNAALFSYDYDFGMWDSLMETDVATLVRDGEAIERKHFKDVRELVQVLTREMIIGGYSVPAANIPYTMTSDAGNILALGKPFAACYWDTPKGRVFSLRSNGEGLDVSEIAKAYGGGGHRNAAGFEMPRGWEGDDPKALLAAEIEKQGVTA